VGEDILPHIVFIVNGILNISVKRRSCSRNFATAPSPALLYYSIARSITGFTTKQGSIAEIAVTIISVTISFGAG